MSQNCILCHAEFKCEVHNIEHCWYYQYPAIIPIDETINCICENCLREKISAKIKDICLKDYDNLDRETKLLIKQLPKTKKLLADIDYTIENGLYVFSKWYHLKRGYCCGNGCKNCAF